MILPLPDSLIYLLQLKETLKMEFYGKLTVFILILNFLAIFGRSLDRIQDGQDHNLVGHNVEKRSIGYIEGDDSDIFQQEYENAFERPHRIRVLPGFLH
ncbi:unnamed protein product, partial [Brenthis ino]